MKKSVKSKVPAKQLRRVKCACASCVCTVNPDKAVQRGNLVFCGEACAAKACTVEECHCEHDDCAM